MSIIGNQDLLREAADMLTEMNFEGRLDLVRRLREALAQRTKEQQS